MKKILYIIKSNLITILSFFVIIFIFVFISALIEDNFTYMNAFLGTLSSLLDILMFFLPLYLLVIIVLDLFFFVLIKANKIKLKYKLLIEWMIISLPLFYYYNEYKNIVLLLTSVSILVGQILELNILKPNSPL